MITPKGKLIIVGGAIDNSKTRREQLVPGQHKTILQEITSRLSGDQQGQIEIISAGSETPRKIAKEYIEAFQELDHSKVDYLNILNKGAKHAKTIHERIRKANCILFTGGDQLRLYQRLIESKITALIQSKYFDEDFIVAGISAGAAVLSQAMIIAGNPGLGYHKGAVKLSSGLWLLSNAIIDTHFDKRGRFGRLAQAVLMQKHSTGIGIGEDTGVVVTNGNILTAIGSSSVVIIEQKEMTDANLDRIAEGEAVSARNLKVHLLAKGDCYAMTENHN